MRRIKLPCQPTSGIPGSPDSFKDVIRQAVVIGNGLADTENQCLGLVRALSLSSRGSLYAKGRHQQVVKLASSFRPPKSGLTNQENLWRSLENEEWSTVGGFISPRHRFSSKFHKMIFVVQIQHPRSQLNKFDLVITPRHDYYPLTPRGQKQIPWFLHKWITPREPTDRHVADSPALFSAASVWHDELGPLPKPLLVVNIGGPISHCEYGVDLAKQLADMLRNVLWSCGSVRISFSSRTAEKILMKEFSNNPRVYIWDGEGPNLHMGHLAWADAFVITADSVSMMSEAGSTGKPVYVVGAERCRWKFADFQKRLQELGVVRRFTGKEDISETWSYPPLDDTKEAASRVVEVLAEHGWTIQAQFICHH